MKQLKKLTKANKRIIKYLQNVKQITIKFIHDMKKIALLSVALALLASCNVTRKVTTEAHYVQKGDTSVLIQTKTIETYDASKKGI